MNIEIGVGIGSDSFASQGNIDRIYALAWASALSPSVSASSVVNTSVNAVTANNNASVLVPTISNAQNVSTLAIVTNVNSIALLPSITGIRNISINDVAANVSASGLTPDVSNNQSASVLAVMANMNNDAIIPVVSVVRNPTVNAVIVNSTASAGVPTVTVSGTVTTIVSDSFNRADNTTSLGVADTGQTWENALAGFGIISNQAYTAMLDDRLAVVDSGVYNGKAQIKHVVYHEWSKLVWRFTDVNNLYWIEANLVRKKVSGVQTTIATLPQTPTNGSVVKIEFNGNVHTIYINDVQVGTFTDSFNQTATKHGIGIYMTTARFDDFLVQTL